MHSGEEEPALALESLLDLVLRVHGRLHSYWTLYVTSQLALVGWFLSMAPHNLDRWRYVLLALTIGINAGSLRAILVLRSYLVACTAETAEAARVATFRTAALKGAVSSIRTLPRTVVAIAHIVVAFLVSVALCS